VQRLLALTGKLLRMLESFGVLAVCLFSWILYERGDGWDALFLILFSLSQLINDPSTKLFWKCFLPSLVLCQYVFKHYSQPSSRVRGLVARGAGASAARKRKKQPIPTSPASPESASPDTPQDCPSSESTKARTSSRTRTSSISSNTGKDNFNGKICRGSTQLSHRVLTLTCHLNVIRNTIHHSPIGSRVNDEVELSVYAAMLLFVMALPVYPGIAVITTSLLAHGSHYLLNNWDAITSFLWPKVTYVCGVARQALRGPAADATQTVLCAVASATSEVSANASSESLAHVAALLARGMSACHSVVSEYLPRLGAVMSENEECLYAAVFVCEPYLTAAMMKAFSWLGIHGRARPNIVKPAAAALP